MSSGGHLVAVPLVTLVALFLVRSPVREGFAWLEWDAPSSNGGSGQTTFPKEARRSIFQHSGVHWERLRYGSSAVVARFGAVETVVGGAIRGRRVVTATLATADFWKPSCRSFFDL